MSQPASKQEWTLLDANGASAVSFTSFIDISYRNEGQVLSYPVEEGGFVNYNKTQMPLDISVTLSTQGSNEDFEGILAKLDTYQKEAVTLSVSTPSAFYDNMTLRGYSYKRSNDANAGLLTVELSLVEVRTVKSLSLQANISQIINPTSSDLISTGKKQVQDATELLKNLFS